MTSENSNFIHRAITVAIELPRYSKLIDFKNKVNDELLKEESLLKKLREDVKNFTETLNF